jgi:hypothetical protein
MNEKDEKLIQDRKTKVQETFGDRNNLYSYLFETLDNFYFRYIETSLSRDLKTAELSAGVFGAVSFENMFEALKNPSAQAKAGIISQAKANKDSTVRMGLWVEVKDLSQDYGKMRFVSEINWGFPDFQDPSKRLQKTVNFEYDDFQVFRKQLALKLEEVSELF